MELVPVWRTVTQTGLVLLFTAVAVLSQQHVPSAKVSTLLKEGKEAEAQGRFSAALADYEAALRFEPGNAQITLQIGLLKGEAGDFAGAVNAFKQALKIQPNFAEAHYNLGLALIANAKNLPVWTQALTEFKAALASRPDYSQALNMAGVCLLESGNAAAAIPELKAALKADPHSGQIHFNLGRALEASGDTTNALTEYEAAVQDKKPFPEAESALGNLLLTKGSVQEATENFKAAVAADPDDQGARYRLARALRAEGKSAEAKLELKQAAMLIQKQSDSIMSIHLSNESLDHAKSGDLSGAIQSARKALWLDPENAIADYNLGLLLADSGNLNASIFEIRKAISLAPLRSVFYVDFAKVQEKAGNSHAALESLRRAAQMDPANQDLQAKAKALETSVHSQPSRKTATKAEDQFFFGAPYDTADGHFAFATQLSKEGDFLGSIGEMLRALSEQPGRSDIRYSLAVAETQIGQIDRAELELRTVLLQSPDSVEAHVALGSLLYQAKDFVNAAAEFRQVLALQPVNQQAAQLLKQCQANPPR